MTSQKPGHHQLPSERVPDQIESSQPREMPKNSRPHHHVGSMYLASFVGSLPLFVLLLVVSASWDGYGLLAYSKPIVEFVSLDAVVSAVVTDGQLLVRRNRGLVGVGGGWVEGARECKKVLLAS